MPRVVFICSDAQLYIFMGIKNRNEASVCMKAFLPIPNLCSKAKMPIDQNWNQGVVEMIRAETNGLDVFLASHCGRIEL